MVCRLVPGLGGQKWQKSDIFAIFATPLTYGAISSMSFCPFVMKNRWLYLEESSKYNHLYAKVFIQISREEIAP